MDHKCEQEVQGEKSEEIGGEGPRPWSGPSHSCPEPATEAEEGEAEETEAEAEETEAEAEEGEAEEEEGEAEEVEGEAEEEEGEAEEVEGEAEETAAEEVQSGVQEAPENSQSEPGSQSSPLAGTEVLQTEVMLPAPPHTAGQMKVSSRKRRNAKPGDPANTQRTPPPFIYIVLLFLFFVSTVNSNPIHAMQGALCRDPESAKNVSRIYKGDKLIWSNSYGRIKNCSKDNLKPDEPCWLPNGSLVVQSDQRISFEGNDSLSGGMKAFPSETVFCADLDLPPGPKSLPAPLMNTTANTTSPDTGPPSDRAAIWWSVGGVVITVVITVGIAVVIGRKCRKKVLPKTGQDGSSECCAS
ncbi:uncharacterized protein LOC133141173 [Conger conger]|uniref:uncharacterized protein LOC133141173 n=1 Tax=Conger conger TaxID=82655 RepID=UPI002A5AFCD2|nr:uncharacterized protein LOC133141173 [Conger conger]